MDVNATDELNCALGKKFAGCFIALLRIRRLFLKTEGSTEGLVKAAACNMPLRVSKILSSVNIRFWH